MEAHLQSAVPVVGLSAACVPASSTSLSHRRDHLRQRISISLREAFSVTAFHLSVARPLNIRTDSCESIWGFLGTNVPKMKVRDQLAG
jgi:hypothetical protein